MKTVLASGETTLPAHYALCVHMYASVKIILDNVRVNQDLKAEKEKNKQIQYPVFFSPSFNKHSPTDCMIFTSGLFQYKYNTKCTGYS